MQCTNQRRSLIKFFLSCISTDSLPIWKIITLFMNDLSAKPQYLLSLGNKLLTNPPKDSIQSVLSNIITWVSRINVKPRFTHLHFLPTKYELYHYAGTPVFWLSGGSPSVVVRFTRHEWPPSRCFGISFILAYLHLILHPSRIRLTCGTCPSTTSTQIHTSKVCSWAKRNLLIKDRNYFYLAAKHPE